MVQCAAADLYAELVFKVLLLPVVRQGIDKFPIHDMGRQTG